MNNRQGGGRNQGQGQGYQDNWAQDDQGEDGQANWAPDHQGQGHQDHWGPEDQGQGHQVHGGPDDQGEDDQARQNRQDQEYMEFLEAAIQNPQPYTFELPERTEPIDLTAPQVIDILCAPQPSHPINLTMIIPEPYKKFPVEVSVVGEELRVEILDREFPHQVLNLMWGLPNGPSFRLRRDVILAIARCTTSISIVFVRGKNMQNSRSTLVLIPHNDTVVQERIQLAEFARSLCRWLFPDPDQLLHYDPKSKVHCYRWLLNLATGRAPFANEMTVEEVAVAQYAYDTELHYFFRRTLDQIGRNILQRHIKYEMKKMLTIVAHRLLTRLYNSHERGIDYDEAIGADFYIYNRFCVPEYVAMGPLYHLQWDDPRLDNDNLRLGTLPTGPTSFSDLPNAAIRYWRSGPDGRVPLTDSIDYTSDTSNIFRTHPMRMYHSLFGSWTYVGRITFRADRMLIESYPGQPDVAKRPLPGNFPYSEIMFVRYCAVGHSGYGLSVHPVMNNKRWGYIHFDCDIQLEIDVIHDLLRDHVARWAPRRVHDILPVEGHQREDLMIGDLLTVLFPNDQSRWPEPTYWCVRVANQAAVQANYRELACRVVNKLATKLVRSARPDTGYLDFTPSLTGNISMNPLRWWPYWHGRLDILRQSRQQSHLPHLVLRAQVYQMRYRWVYALFDAPTRA